MALNNKSVILGFFLIFSFSIKGQINNNMDCTFKNSAAFSQLFIDALGEIPINYILDNDIQTTSLWKVDSLGYVKQFTKMLGTKKNFLAEAFFLQLENYFINNNIQFFVCIEGPLIPEEPIANYFITMAFPGQLMTLYPIKNECEETGKTLSKYEYLQKQIEKYGKD